MDIYVVQSGDNIASIADKYNTPVDRLIWDNGLDNPFDLVPGQTIVIVYPERTHTVREGDTLSVIAKTYGVSLMELLRNNSFLSDREYIYAGEKLVISYNTNEKSITNGFAYPFIKNEILSRTLPYLTYLSVFNHGANAEGDLFSYYNDKEIIQTAKNFGVVPLMILTAYSPLGVANTEVVYNMLLSEEHQKHLFDNIISILHTSGYSGVNALVSSINEVNQKLYINFLTNLSQRLKSEGYLLFITMNPNIKYVKDEISYSKLDYSRIGLLTDYILFLQYYWGINYASPSPVSSINQLRSFFEYAVKVLPPDKISIGIPLVAYDWPLPYTTGTTHANFLTLSSATAFASDMGSAFQFDQASQTPFFTYINTFTSIPSDHIVWFIDDRCINEMIRLISEKGLAGSGIWNVMVFYQQVWTIINSQYEIIKKMPDILK